MDYLLTYVCGADYEKIMNVLPVEQKIDLLNEIEDLNNINEMFKGEEEDQDVEKKEEKITTMADCIRIFGGTIIYLCEEWGKLPVEIIKRSIDIAKRKELLDKTLKWKQDKERIIYWTNLAFQELEEKGSLVFTPLFFKIVDTDRLAIAVKTAHSILRKSTKSKQRYKVEIKQEPVNYTVNKRISLWQMTIQKK